MKKIIMKVVVAIIVLVLVVFSPTIVSKLVLWSKSINSVNSIGIVNWLMFYATLSGGICTLLAFVLSYWLNNKQLKEQHKESIRTTIHLDEMNNIAEVNISLSDLIQSFNSNDQLRIVYNFVKEKDYIKAYSIIERVRNNIILHSNNFYLISDIKKDNSNIACNKCELLDSCQEYEKTKKDLDKVLENTYNCYMNTLEKLQNYIDALYKNEKLQNIIIDCNEIIIETLKKISNESLNLDSIQYDSNNQIIENSKRTMEEARNNIISQERIDEYSSELDKAMEEYNQKIIVHMAKLLELSKKYLELKKAISIGKLNLK